MFRSMGATATTLGTSQSVSPPAGLANGDVMLLFSSIDSGGGGITLTPPSADWIQLFEASTSGAVDGQDLQVWKKIANNESGSYAWTSTSAGHWTMHIGAWSGRDVAGTLQFITTVDDTNHTPPFSLTLTGLVPRIHDDIVWVGVADLNTGNGSPYSFSTVPGMVEQVDEGIGTGSFVWAINTMDDAGPWNTGSLSSTFATTGGSDAPAVLGAVIAIPSALEFNSPAGRVKELFTNASLIDNLTSNFLYSVGYNAIYGSLGDNTTVPKSSPVQTVAGGTNWKQVTSNGNTSAGIKSDGTLWLWGNNTFGQLGDNTTTKKSSPVQTVAGGTNWKQICCGGLCFAAIKTDGTLWTWGRNSYGNLGDNSITDRSSPVQTVAGGTNWKQVSCNNFSMAAVKTDGTLWTWGNNSDGQLGDNTIVKKSSPVQTIAGGTNWTQVSSTGSGGTSHVAAIKTDGTLWLWGANLYGSLGDNTITKRSSPIQTVAGGTNWKQVTGGGYNSAAIKTDGTLWTWGKNNTGQLGDNTIVSKSSPVQTVAGGTNWKQVSSNSSGYHMAAIKTDGTLWTWGYNNYGQLADGTRTTRSSPVQTIAGGTNWKQVSTGTQHTAMLTYNDA